MDINIDLINGADIRNYFRTFASQIVIVCISL